MFDLFHFLKLDKLLKNNIIILSGMNGFDIYLENSFANIISDATKIYRIPRYPTIPNILDPPLIFPNVTLPTYLFASNISNP